MTALLAEAARHGVACADDVEVTWITPDAVEQSLTLGEAWSVSFECGLPVRRFAARKGQRHLSGCGGARRQAGMSVSSPGSSGIG